MTNTVDLKLSQEVFEHLHEICETRRSTVKVGRDELATLLLDYSVMLSALRSNNRFRVREPSQQRQRPRLGSQSG